MESSPQNIEAEISILGAALLRSEIIDEVELNHDHFYDKRHQIIWRAMLALQAENLIVDEVTIAQRLKETGDYGRGGVEALYLAQLSAAVATSAEATDHAELVKAAGVKRQAINIGLTLIEDARQHGTTAAGLVSSAEAALMQIGESSIGGAGVQIRDRVNDVFSAALARTEKGSAVTGVTTGLVDIDRLLGGLHPMHLSILAARPGMGKTALALHIAKSAARSGVPVYFFSLEMSTDELIGRVLCSEAEVNTERFTLGQLEQRHKNKLSTARTTLTGRPLVIQDRPALNINQMRSMARRAKRKHGIGPVIVDYVGLARADVGKNGNREREIAEISQGLKAMAKELNVPVLALSQLNREVEKRDDKQPKLSDLRESGALEQDADQVFFLFWKHYYSELAPRNKSMFIVAKNRHGRIGPKPIYWKPEFTQFGNYITLDEQPSGPERA